MIEVPVTWLSFCDDNPPKGRWDQMFLERLIHGAEWTVPYGYDFKETDDWSEEGGVLVFPASHYVEHGEVDVAIGALEHLLAVMKWTLIIATCDEASLFPWSEVKGFDDRHRLWLQTPDPRREYPEGTKFIPIGSHTSAIEFARIARPNWEKDADLFFSGQITHARREQMWTALSRLATKHVDLNIKSNATKAFASGLGEGVYVREMTDAKIVPCPSGIVSEDSFRLWETLEAQGIPLGDGIRGDGVPTFWSWLTGYAPIPLMPDWNLMDPLVPALLPDWRRDATRISAWWQQYKRQLAWDLHDTVHTLSERGWPAPKDANDDVTVLVPTSPMPSNPDISIIEETVQSVKDRLPGAEIIIMIDGVREEQHDREADYIEYARRVCARYNADPHVVPVFHEEHMHQSGMTRHALDLVRTEYIMFVEHDTPLIGDINFDAVLTRMHQDGINVMRFHHDVSIHETSAHLYLETEPGESPYLRTVQWSQRPHVACTRFYRWMIAKYFGVQSRTMIEDVMHGVVQHEHFGSRKRVHQGWENWRIAVWAPEPWNLKRSGHLDGRGDDPKYPMLVAYDGERPEGAPPEGFLG